MPTDQIVALLRAERSRIDAALLALEGGTKRMGRPSKDTSVPDWVSGNTTANTPKRKSRKFTKKQREQQSAFMRAQWAKRKRAAAGKAGGNKAAKS
jgi:hypothetical protein